MNVTDLKGTQLEIFLFNKSYLNKHMPNVCPGSIVIFMGLKLLKEQDSKVCFEMIRRG